MPFPFLIILCDHNSDTCTPFKIELLRVTCIMHRSHWTCKCDKNPSHVKMSSWNVCTLISIIWRFIFHILDQCVVSICYAILWIERLQNWKFKNELSKKMKHLGDPIWIWHIWTRNYNITYKRKKKNLRIFPSTSENEGRMKYRQRYTKIWIITRITINEKWRKHIGNPY